jgi:hypothetical protein
MSTHESFERRLRAELAALLEKEGLPHPAWADSPAAIRVERDAAHRRRLPLRLLAIAAILVVGGAAAGAGALLLRPEPATPLADGWVAYSTGYEDRSDIMFVRPGGVPRLAGGAPGDGIGQSCPAFSPDGRLLAFNEIAPDAPTWSLAVVELGGDGLPTPSLWRYTFDEPAGEATGRLAITTSDFATGEGVATCPKWSPDGTHVAVLTFSGIRVVDLASGVVSPLDDYVRDPGGDDEYLVGAFEWAPDSNGIIHTHNLGPGNETSELWWASLTGSERRLLAGTRDERIHWLDAAADGRLAVAGTASVVTEAANGSGYSIERGDGFVRVLDVSGGGGAPVDLDGRPDMIAQVTGLTWAPDGATLAYIASQELIVHRPGSAGHVVPLVVDGVRAFPGCLNSWSPSAERLVVVAYESGSYVPVLGTKSILLSVDPTGRTDPVVLRGWDVDMWGICGVTSWQPTSASQPSGDSSLPSDRPSSPEPSATDESRSQEPRATRTPVPVPGPSDAP